MNVILYGKGNFAYMVKFRIMKWEYYYELGFYLCIWAIVTIINVFFKGRNHRFENGTLLGFEHGRGVMRQEYKPRKAGNGKEMNSVLDFSEA